MLLLLLVLRRESLSSSSRLDDSMDEGLADNELWACAEALQGSTTRLRHTLNVYLSSLPTTISNYLGNTKINGVEFTWTCAPVLAGGAGRDVALADKANDLDIVVVLKPSVKGYTVTTTYNPALSQCAIHLQPSSRREKAFSIAIGNGTLETIWQAFRRSIQDFAATYKHILGIKEAPDHPLVSFNAKKNCQMRCSFTLGEIPVDVLPAFETQAGVHLVLLRELEGGANVRESFSTLAAARLAALPDKGRHMICALKYIKYKYKFDVPSCLFEALVIEVFEKNEWIGPLDDVQQAGIHFQDAWRQCWERLLLPDAPIAAPAASVQRENLLTKVEKNEPRLLARAADFAALDEEQLLAEFPAPAPATGEATTTSTTTEAATTPTTATATGAATTATTQAATATTTTEAATTATTQAATTSTTSEATAGGFSLRQWLASIKLSEYSDLLITNGFGDDDWETIAGLTKEDLTEVGITLVGHRNKLLREAEKLRATYSGASTSTGSTE